MFSEGQRTGGSHKVALAGHKREWEAMPRDEKDGNKWCSNKKAKKKGLDWKHRSAKQDATTRQEREELREERKAKGLCLKADKRAILPKSALLAS